MTITPIAVYFLYFIFSRPESQLCTPDDRSNTCIADDEPVCALYTGDDCHSSTGFCYRTLPNTCACNDDTIVGYTPGPCQEPTLPHVCKKRERGLACAEEETEPVCAFSKPQRFRGKSSLASTFSNSCEACDVNQVAFHVPGECDESDSMRICRNNRNTECSEEQAEPLCAYYTGGDCTEKICRKTELNSCNVCQESSVLFYVRGACEGPEKEEVGTADEVDGDCYVEPQEDIPLVDVNEVGYPPEVSETEEVIPELEPVMQLDGTIIYEKVETLTYEDLKNLQKSVELTNEDCIEPQENIPELEAVVQEDGSVTYEEVQPEQSDEPIDVDCIVEEQLDIPELEAVMQDDGSMVYEEVEPVREDEARCGHEEQFNIPELEAVIQEDGSVVYEQVEPTLTANEETLITSEEEKAEPSSFLTEVIESRFLVNEPSN